MEKIKITRWNDAKGYNVVIEVELSGHETEAMVNEIINDQLDNPLTHCVEYKNEIHFGKFQSPTEVL